MKFVIIKNWWRVLWKIFLRNALQFFNIAMFIFNGKYEDVDSGRYGAVGDQNKSWIFVIVKNVLQFWCEKI